MRLLKFTDEIMGSEVHCSLKDICEATNSAVLPCMVMSYELLCLPHVPVTFNYVSKLREMAQCTGSTSSPQTTPRGLMDPRS